MGSSQKKLKRMTQAEYLYGIGRARREYYNMRRLGRAGRFRGTQCAVLRELQVIEALVEDCIPEIYQANPYLGRFCCEKCGEPIPLKTWTCSCGKVVSKEIFFANNWPIADPEIEERWNECQRRRS